MTLPELFEKATRRFIDSIKNFTKEKFNLDIEVTDLQLLDGYFIFEFGDNSVVNFYIDKCPGWKFGIWWDAPTDCDCVNLDTVDVVKGMFFTMYEETADKFKPSRAEYKYDIDVYLNSDCYYFEEPRTIAFISQHPELAFCRDYNGWDYNLEYHSEEEAKEEYAQYRKWKDNKDAQTIILDNKMIEFAKEKMLPIFNNAELVDLGEGWSPRYDIHVPLEDNPEIADKTGCYACFSEDEKELQEEYNNLIKECKAVSDEYEFSWWSPVEDNIIVRRRNASNWLDIFRG